MLVSSCSMHRYGNAYLRNKRGDADTEVDVEAVADLASGALRNTVPPVLGHLVVALSRSGLFRLRLLARRQLRNLDRLGLGRLHDTIDVDARHMDRVRRQTSDGPA